MKKLISIMLVLAMVLVMMAGCGNSSAPAAAADTASASAAAPDQDDAPEADEADEDEDLEDSDEEASAVEAEDVEEAGNVYVELPIVEDEVHYTCWMPMAPFLDMLGIGLDSFSEDVAMVRILNEMTNVYIDFNAVAGGFGEDEKFNLMVAANDYCDIIGITSYYNTGIDGAIADEVIVDIREDLEEYAPNYMNLLKSNQKAYLNMLTDSGAMGCIAQLLKKPGTENMGMIIRKDWLQAAGMDKAPETMDEAEEYLRFAKENYGAYSYIQYEGNDTNWGSAFNVTPGGFNVHDGKVVHAYEQPEYQDYLATMHDWYVKGYFNDDFYNDTDLTDVRNDMANDMCSYVEYSAAGMTDIYQFNTANTDMVLMAMAYPKAEGVDAIHVGYESELIKNADTWAISTACEDREPLMQLINWLYSEEGQYYYNWGEEGVAHTIDENGEPQWTDLITNNPDGLSYMFATYKYAASQASTFFPGVFDMEKGFYDFTEEQLEAVDVLANLTDGAYNIDKGVSLTLDEQTEYASISNEMATYADSEILKFIMGDRDLATYDDFLADVQSMGLDRMTEIEQAAYDRYIKKLG